MNNLSNSPVTFCTESLMDFLLTLEVKIHILNNSTNGVFSILQDLEILYI